MRLHWTSGRRCAVGAALAGLLSPLVAVVPVWASSVANEVVFTADADNDGIYTVVLRNLETQQSTTLLPEDATNEWTYDDPELSPDGGRVVLSTDRGSATSSEGLAVVNRDGSGFRRITEPPRSAASESVDLAPAWSPSGDRIVFTRITTPVGSRDPLAVRTALHVVPGAGGTPVPYGQAADGYTADWSPDGNRIVFAALAPGGDSGPLTVISSDPASTGGRTNLGVTGLMPAWSPDGSTIAYATITARDTDRARAQDTALIATVPAAGGGQRLLSPTRPDPARPSVAEYPAWTPDGQSIVYDVFGYAAGAVDLPPGDLWAVDRLGVRAGRLLRTGGDEAQPHLQGPAPAAVSAGSPSEYVPVTPTRVLDTRPGPGTVGAPAGQVGPGGTVDLRVHGLATAQGAVPASATAVVLNVTAVEPSAVTDIRVYPTPTDSAVPRSSNLNTGPGRVVPNLVTATLGTGGSVRLRNAAGRVHLIADVAGYYVPTGAGGSGFTAVDPGRILDTRPAPNNVGAPAASVGPAGTVDLQVTGSLPTSDGRTVTVPGDARAVVLNVTATGVTANTNVRVYPAPASGAAVPTVSNLNVGPGQTAANLMTVPVGAGGKVRLRNAQGRVQLLADLAGYYSAGSSGKFVPVAPTRFLDTRSGVGAAPIATTAAGFLDLLVAGARGVPAGATAAVLNVTGTGVTATTNVRAYPATAGRVPTVSNLNLERGETRANLTVVKVGTDGQVRVRNAAGELQLISDLAGYFVG
jgi:hypothetical protein